MGGITMRFSIRKVPMEKEEKSWSRLMSRSKGFIVVLERKEDEEAGQVVKPHIIFVSCFSRPCQAILFNA